MRQEHLKETSPFRYSSVGRNTRVIQSARSVYFPILRDVSRETEKKDKSTWVSYLGARPMHRTTLSLGPRHVNKRPGTNYNYVSTIVIC